MVGWVSPQTPTIYPADKPWVGINMSAIEGNWGPDVSFTYKWYAGTGTTPVGTASDLVLTNAMLGKPIRLTVTGKSHGQTASRTSADTAPVQLTPLRSSTPTVTGAAVVSRALTAKTGAWTTGTAFTYRWLAGGLAVPGATKSTFAPSVTQTGKTIRVEVTGTKPGYAPTVRTSAATAAVTYAPWTPVKPIVTGDSALPQRAEHGTVLGKRGQLRLPVAEERGADQRGHRQPLHTHSGHGRPHHQRARHGHRAEHHADAPRVQRRSDRTWRAALPAPSISGTKKVGRTLTAVPHSWTPGTSLRYQWYAGSAAIRYATHRTYKLPNAAKGKRIRVKVTGRKAGYTTAAKYSARTPKIS